MTNTRLIGAACAAVIALFLAGCSWITDFAISNTTGHDLFVSYRVRTCPEGNFITIPARKSNSELNDEQKRWTDLTPEQYSCEPSTGIVKTVLPPAMTLRLARIATYTGPKNYGNEDFEVLRLELEGAEGSVSLKGAKVIQSFTPESRVLYVLRY